MTKSRDAIVENPDELALLINLPPEMVVAIPTVVPAREAIKIMAGLSRAGSYFYGLFKPELEKQALAKALHHAAFARQKDVDTLLAMLEANPRLLLKAGNVITPGGLDVRGVTIYEFLLGAGDPNLAKRVEPFFEKLENGQNERTRQFERYRPHIDAMLTQEPDDLKCLFDIIKQSSADDVAAELATGDQYDTRYQSPLRDAFNKFREVKLDPQVRIMTEPRMHCNYQNLIHAYSMLALEWDNLYAASGNNYKKLYLVAREIIGLIELIELPGYERCLFARGQVKAAAAGKEIERSHKYENGSGSFPNFDSSLVTSHSGVGFDSFISISGGWPLTTLAGDPLLRAGCETVTELMVSKNVRLAELMQPHPKKKKSRCVVC